VTRFAPHLALKLIACGKLTFDERVVLHRVGGVVQGYLAHKQRLPARTLQQDYT
jgi:hypothetical protein